MYSLLSHNTFGIDVSATCFLEYSSEEELMNLMAEGRVKTPFLHIGKGSNLLFTKDYEGIVLHSRIESIGVVKETPQEVWIKAGAGVVWDDFVRWCVRHKYYGAENLSLIPGEVGACAVQNIGAYGVEAKDLISFVETINLEGTKRIYTAEECQYAYRDSLFKRPEYKSCFITYVCFRLSKREHYTLDYGAIRQELEKYGTPDLETLRKIIVGIRKSKLPDPKVWGNAGSFYMNPIVTEGKLQELQQQYPQMPYYKLFDGRVKIPAGWMIEQCGWKGKSLGPAAVYDKQALVLVNLGGATGRDILALSDAVRNSVHRKFGIEIKPEVIII